MLWILVAAGGGILSPVSAQPQQPLAYSHQLHVEKGLQCLDCHSGADSGAAATLPSTSKCMLCHAKLATDKPEIQKLADFAKRRREVPWVRVYQFAPEALVRFRHDAHVNQGVACATCHGDVSKMTVARKAVTHTMGTCVTCHRQNKASDDCATCHY